MTLQQLEEELIELPATERLRLARWLLDTLLDNQSNNLKQAGTSLLNVAGHFHGGPGDTAEHAEEILANEVNSLVNPGVNQPIVIPSSPLE